ncbi:MAG: hypothetical protein IPH97_12725 [Ignavibacteriales bacterium]|nr:hypothetical protein [Ignavibacteriales bacterium]
MQTPLEKILVSSCKEEMIVFLKTHPQYFNEAIRLAISDNQPFAWRSAFVLFDCIDENDNRVKKQINTILNCIKDKKDGHQRELLKILYKMKLNKQQEGIVFDICIRLWEQIGKDPSVRMTALKFIIKTANKYPELLEEISFLLQEQYLVTLSPGVKNSIRKMINEVIKQDE